MQHPKGAILFATFRLSVSVSSRLDEFAGWFLKEYMYYILYTIYMYYVWVLVAHDPRLPPRATQPEGRRLKGCVALGGSSPPAHGHQLGMVWTKAPHSSATHFIMVSYACQSCWQFGVRFIETWCRDFTHQILYAYISCKARFRKNEASEGLDIPTMKCVEVCPNLHCGHKTDVTLKTKCKCQFDFDFLTFMSHFGFIFFWTWP